ncbi:Heat shock factor protein 2 [Aphanomyces cochlioides]|nr:Heat shock factor protein 2 [Aphanomyces cochlioides]
MDSAPFKAQPHVASFIQALYTLTHKGAPYVDWSSDGTTFRILDVKRFAAEVLPRYFKHSNMASFQRQLNYFSFKKATKNHRTLDYESRRSPMAEFHHPWFRRDMDERILPCFRRKKPHRAVEPLMDVYVVDDSRQVHSTATPALKSVDLQEVRSKNKTKKVPTKVTLRTLETHPKKSESAESKNLHRIAQIMSSVPPPIQAKKIEPLQAPSIPRYEIKTCTATQHRESEQAIDLSWLAHDRDFAFLFPMSSGESEWHRSFDLCGLSCDVLPLVEALRCEPDDSSAEDFTVRV